MNFDDLPTRLANANLGTLQEIIREAEVHLASQQAVAIAADQRAMTLTGFMSAAAIVLIGGSASYALGEHRNVSLAVICFAVACGLIVSSALSVYAAAPSPFDFAGSSPADWQTDVERDLTLDESLRQQSRNYAEMIHDNHDRMKLNSRRLWIAILVALWSIIVGGAVFAFALVMHHG